MKSSRRRGGACRTASGTTSSAERSRRRRCGATARRSAPSRSGRACQEADAFVQPEARTACTNGRCPAPSRPGRSAWRSDRRSLGTWGMNGEAVSYITRHGVPSLRTRSRPHPEPTPMTTDERWPPARLRLCPATPPLTNNTWSVQVRKTRTPALRACVWGVARHERAPASALLSLERTLSRSYRRSHARERSRRLSISRPDPWCT